MNIYAYIYGERKSETESECTKEREREREREKVTQQREREKDRERERENETFTGEKYFWREKVAGTQKAESKISSRTWSARVRTTQKGWCANACLSTQNVTYAT